MDAENNADIRGCRCEYMVHLCGEDAQSLILADADIGADIYLQYLRMRIRMLKIMRISADADEDTRSTSTKDGEDAESLILVDADIGTDVYFQYLRMRMRMLKIMWISADADVDIRSIYIRDVLSCK